MRTQLLNKLDVGEVMPHDLFVFIEDHQAVNVVRVLVKVGGNYVDEPKFIGVTLSTFDKTKTAIDEGWN